MFRYGLGSCISVCVCTPSRVMGHRALERLASVCVYVGLDVCFGSSVGDVFLPQCMLRCQHPIVHQL